MLQRRKTRRKKRQSTLKNFKQLGERAKSLHLIFQDKITVLNHSGAGGGGGGGGGSVTERGAHWEGGNKNKNRAGGIPWWQISRS